MIRVLPVALAMILLSLAPRMTAQDNAQLEIGGGKIDVAFSSTPAEPLRKLVLGWITSSARAVTVYYERFPFHICSSKSDLSKEAVCAEAERPAGAVRRSRSRSDARAPRPILPMTGC